MIRHAVFLLMAACLAATCPTAPAQETSVNPGINDSFLDPDIDEFVGRFEVESREVFDRRHEIIKACQVKPGESWADVGAGTGLFTRLLSDAVGKDGQVIAVEISEKFLEHIKTKSRELQQRNVQTVLGTSESTRLPENSLDGAFICDTYHHFEFPMKTMKSIHTALKPGGRVVLVDFRRIPGQSSEWVLGHVRAGQEAFEAEIVEAGFRRVREEKDLLEENYFVVFEKPGAEETATSAGPPFGRGRGRGPGGFRGRGPRADMRADQELFHYLLARHAEIDRTVKRLDNGVETVTESGQPEVARRIQEHVASMHERVKEGRGLRYWDPLFEALFSRHASIKMSVERTEKGVRVRETSDDPAVVALIQAHAEVVSQFVKRGFAEAQEDHPVP